MKLYVGNLPVRMNDSDLRSMFEEFGPVESAHVVMDRDSGLCKGFAFIEMGNDQKAQTAIHTLNNKEMDGRALTVNEVKPPKDRGDRWHGWSRDSGGGSH